MQYKNELIAALLLEMDQRADYLKGEPVRTIYIGGGTPSLLHPEELGQLLRAAKNKFAVDANAECTLEANPDDIDAEAVRSWASVGINRLSIGVQSFFDEDLHYMNRAHRADQALQAIKAAQDAGIRNLSTDLIFGYPLLTMDKWKQNIETMLSLEIPHLSCYGMTVEPKTALASFIDKGKEPALDSEQSATQFEYLMDRLEQAGYEQYEVSNFALPGKRAVHNSSYWNRSAYLGIGPSAHSFDGVSRQWNVANNAVYIREVNGDGNYFQREELRRADRVNEQIMTGLRLKEGFSLEKLGLELLEEEIREMEGQLAQFIRDGWVWKSGQLVGLTKSGMLFADKLAAELFILN